MIRLGLVVFATDTGLGIQTRSLYQHLKPAKTMLVDLSQYNHMPIHEDWYDADVRTHGMPSSADVDSFLDGLDVVMCCETPLNYRLFSRARELGIRTVLQYNYEFLDYLGNAGLNLPLPDVLAAPTSWHLMDVQSMLGTRRMPSTSLKELPVPIDLDELPRRTITSARHFFHIAGRPAIHDRNGTLDFIAAAKVGARHMPDASFTVYCQQPTAEIERAASDGPVAIVGHVSDPASMYLQSDILVLPRRYGGLCLPAQEAVGCGIPVLMPNVSPNDAWLPHAWLSVVRSDTEYFTTRSPIAMHSVDVDALAIQMVGLYHDDDLVKRWHTEAQHLALSMSWDALLPLYEEVLGLRGVAV